MSIEQEISKNRTSLMGVSMLSIMLFHQSWIWGWNPFFAFFHFFGNWGVDIFFFVSGFGLFYSLKKDGNILSFYKRRLIRMIPLCLVCGSFRYIVDHILPVGIGGYPTGVHEVSSDWMTILSLDKWFVAVILGYYLLMPLLYKSVGRYSSSILWMGYVVAFLGALSLVPSWMVQYTIRFPSFCIGIITAAGMLKLPKVGKAIGFVAVFVALTYKFVGMMGWFPIDDDYTYIILSFGVVVLCLSIIRIASIPYVKNCKIGRLVNESICFIGRRTLEIYLLHEFVYRYTYRFLIDSPVPLFLQMLIGMASSVVIACIFSQIVGRFKKVTSSVEKVYE